MFRILSFLEVTQFQQWARENYKVGEPIEIIYHPVIQLECLIMNLEEVTPPNERRDLIDNMKELLLKYSE